MIARPLVAWIARRAARFPVALNREWPVLRHGKRLLLRSLRRESVEVDGFSLLLDPTDSLRLGMGDRHQDGLIRFLSRVLRPGDAAVDGGAHIGYLSLHMARRVGPDGVVWAFEPDPANFDLLRANLERNRFPWAHARQAALWRAPGRRFLYRSEDHHADHRMGDPGGRRTTVEVETVTLERALAGQRRPRLIKLDVQGSELAALEGAGELLRAVPEIVVAFELWPAGLGSCGDTAADLLRFLEQLGFALWTLNRDGGLRATGADALLARLCPSRPLARLTAALRASDAEDAVAMRAGIAANRGIIDGA